MITYYDMTYRTYKACGPQIHPCMSMLATGFPSRATSLPRGSWIAGTGGSARHGPTVAMRKNMI